MITLPWPPRELSPNASGVHWGTKARAFKAYRTDCWAVFAGNRSKLRGRSSFAVTFHPPSARRHDIDNCFASIKACIDALSQITGIDDSEFQFTIAKGEPRTGGAVIIT